MTTKLLVVDDEPVIRNFLVRVLAGEGYDVQPASDGREALGYLNEGPFDLLLTDIKMDHLDGVELLREAKARYPNLAVILLTGHATVPSAIEALRRGAHDYLLKPVRNEDIVAAVAAALDDRERQRRRDQLETLAGQMLDVLQTGEPANAHSRSPRTITHGPLELDTAAYIATLDGGRLDLTPTEFRLLTELTRDPGVTRDYVKLVEGACGYTCSRQEAREIIGTHVLNLRSKLAIDPDAPLYVESIRGVGYRIIPVD